jgi:hypothetical protein
MRAPSKKKKIPFEFVLEQLILLDPIVKQMFGCHAIYVGDKIVLILRHREDHPLDNGVWVATMAAHHSSLKKEFPSIRSIDLLGNGATNWQVIPLDADDFEEEVIHACELILRRDERIGTIPKSKKKGRSTGRDPSV